MLAADRREAELAFDRQPNERLAGGFGQRSLAGETILGQRECACLGVELLDYTDAPTIRVDIRAAQRIQLPRTQAREAAMGACVLDGRRSVAVLGLIFRVGDHPVPRSDGAGDTVLQVAHLAIEGLVPL